jgi:hypothetical protein
MVTLKSVTLNGESFDLSDNKRIYINGKKLPSDNGEVLLFYYDDPCIVIEVKDRVRSTGNTLRVSMNAANITKDMAEALKKEISKKIRL